MAYDVLVHLASKCGSFLVLDVLAVLEDGLCIGQRELEISFRAIVISGPRWIFQTLLPFLFCLNLGILATFNRRQMSECQNYMAWIGKPIVLEALPIVIVFSTCSLKTPLSL